MPVVQPQSKIDFASMNKCNSPLVDLCDSHIVITHHQDVFVYYMYLRLECQKSKSDGLPEAVSESRWPDSPRDALVKIVRSLVNGTRDSPTITFDRCDHQLRTETGIVFSSPRHLKN